MVNDKQTWLEAAYAECTRLGHHATGSPSFHNGVCQEGYSLSKKEIRQIAKDADSPIHK
jgi:hypothetical protein